MLHGVVWDCFELGVAWVRIVSGLGLGFRVPFLQGLGSPFLGCRV